MMEVAAKITSESDIVTRPSATASFGATKLPNFTESALLYPLKLVIRAFPMAFVVFVRDFGEEWRKCVVKHKNGTIDFRGACGYNNVGDNSALYPPPKTDSSLTDTT